MSSFNYLSSSCKHLPEKVVHIQVIKILLETPVKMSDFISDDESIDLSSILKMIDLDASDVGALSSSSLSDNNGTNNSSSDESSQQEASQKSSTSTSRDLSGFEVWNNQLSVAGQKSEPQDSYYLYTKEQVHKVNQEVELCLKSTSLESEVPIKSGLELKSSAVHSSGFIYPVCIQKIDSISGYVLRFYPHVAGMYSISVVLKNQTTGQTVGKDLAAPIEIQVSKNYEFDAKSPVVESISIGLPNSKFWGITSDKFSDTLYLTDRETHEVLAFHPETSKTLFRFGNSIQAGVPSLFRPTGLVCDQLNKRLIICDKDNHRVVFLTLDGQFISSFGSKGHSNGQFNYPWDVDISPRGNLIVISDSRNHRIQLFDKYGNFLGKYSVFELCPFEYKTLFDYPRGVTFGKDGKNIFVTDFNTHNVVSIDINLMESRMLIPPGKMCRPQGITMDETGNLIVCDSRKNCLRVMTSQGDLISTINGIGQFELTIPSDATFLRGGELAVVDVFGRIRII